MDQIQEITTQAIESNEFGPMFDWLVENGLGSLQTRIADLIALGELQYVFSVYLRDLDLATLEQLDHQARAANRILKRN